MKKVLYLLVILLILAVGLTGYGSFYLLNYSLKPKNHGQNSEASYEYLFQTYPYMESWIDSLNREQALKDTFILSKEGINLHAYYIQANKPTSKTALLIHGYSGNAIQMLALGYMYSKELEYNIFLPELQYSGLSRGDHIQMGWLDRLDILNWMTVANHIYGDSTQMVVHGISMGGATTMMVSGENVPSYVKCFIEDCGYTSVWDEFKHQLKEQFSLPAFPLMNVASGLCELKYGWNFKEASSLKQIKKCQLPMFFIHGDKDDFVPTSMVYPLYEAKSPPKELWIVPGAAHGVSYRNNTVEYTARVKEFTSKYIY